MRAVPFIATVVISTTNYQRAKDRPTFTLRLRAEPGTDAIRALRWLLRSMLRQGRLRCVWIAEDHSHEDENAKSTTSTNR
jgi:hypothetical protein